MKFVVNSCLVLSLSILSGCTAIGTVVDIAIAGATSNSGEHNNSKNTKETGFEFAKVGAEVDAAIIAGLVEDYKGKKEGVNAIGEEPENDINEPLIPTQSAFVGLCTRKLEKDEPCYSKNYYHQFRIQLTEEEAASAQQ